MKPAVNVRVLFWIVLLLLSNHLAAQIGPKERILEARVPFTFQVGDMHFPPGTYTFSHLGPQAVVIEKDDRSAMGMLLVQTESLHAHKNKHQGKLVFNVYRDHRFLSQIWTGVDGQIHHARKYSAERQLEASLGGTTVSIRAER
jgi:hypothetical protein